MNRENNGIEILNKNFPQKTFRFLGEGKSSVVFTDEILVYKVFLLENYEALGYKRNILNKFKRTNTNLKTQISFIQFIKSLKLVMTVLFSFMRLKKVNLAQHLNKMKFKISW
jgi:hypothetical protein